MSRFFRSILMIAAVAVVCRWAGWAQEDAVGDAELSPQMQQRLERLRAQREQRARADAAGELPNATGGWGVRALSAPTLGGGRPSPQAVPNATDVSLDIDGDFNLGGFLFKGAVPFLHNDGGVTYANTALGLNALTSLTPGYPVNGSLNTAVGFDAMTSITSGFSNAGVGANALRSNTASSFNTAAGAFALYNTTGERNTGVGISALYGNTTGTGNTAVGQLAMMNFGGLYGSGYNNTAVGSRALYDNDNGNSNTAMGTNALSSNTSSSFNTAIGVNALVANGSGWNTAIGNNAGQYWTNGQDNIALGTGAYGVAGESNTIRIGGMNYQNTTYIEGIRGASNPLGYYFDHDVCTNSLEQLGSCNAPSSIRFKESVTPMGNVSSQLDNLQAITFLYKNRPPSADSSPHYGLIAEEVAEVFPHVVRYDEEGKPYTIRYELLTPMLLKELQDEKQRREAEVEDLRQQVADLRRIVGDLKRRDEIPRE